ncbi:MAG: hypothetical protein RR186_01035, partial [Raoultibacter sp.]
MKKRTAAIALTGLLAVVAVPTVAFAASGNDWQATASAPTAIEQPALIEKAEAPAPVVAVEKDAPVEQAVSQNNGFVD